MEYVFLFLFFFGLKFQLTDQIIQYFNRFFWTFLRGWPNSIIERSFIDITLAVWYTFYLTLWKKRDTYSNLPTISTIDNQVFKSHPIIFNLLKVNNCAGSSSDSQFLTSNFQTVIRFGKQNWCGNWWKFLEFNQKTERTNKVLETSKQDKFFLITFNL